MGNQARGPNEVAYRQVENPSEVVVFFKIEMRKEAFGLEYERTTQRMHELVSLMPGFISIKEFTSEDGESVQIVRFGSPEALEAWRVEAEHLKAQRRGQEFFYSRYWVQVCKVVREYEFSRDGAEEGPPPAQPGGAR